MCYAMHSSYIPLYTTWYTTSEGITNTLEGNRPLHVVFCNPYLYQLYSNTSIVSHPCLSKDRSPCSMREHVGQRYRLLALGFKVHSTDDFG